jgi:predicted benzoate:H+ symporter BenE
MEFVSPFEDPAGFCSIAVDAIRNEYASQASTAAITGWLAGVMLGVAVTCLYFWARSPSHHQRGPGPDRKDE